MFRRLVPLLLLISVAASASSCFAKSEYDKRVLQARETVLRDNLYHIRKAIDLYSADHGALPQSLDELVKAGYMREIPLDPITGGTDWKVVIGDNPNAKGQRGIVDVHSAATTKSSEGTLYSEW